jgi:hypothetical protein
MWIILDDKITPSDPERIASYENANRIDLAFLLGV